MNLNINSQTVFVSLASSVSGIQFVPIVLGDEFENVVVFAQSSLTQNATAVVLEQFYFSQTAITSYAPFNLILDPSTLEASGKIYKIEYDFGNGNVHTQNFYYANTSVDTMALPHNTEPGDPRNFNIDETFYIDKPEQKYIPVEVRIYSIGLKNYERYYVNLFLNPPELDGELNNYFKDLHLISTRMFDTDDKVFYIFESQSPNYILPSLVKWDRNIAQEADIQIIQDRSYKLLQPFEKENVSSIETKYPISFVEPVSSDSVIIDTGL
jgi:hypothetical protein